MPIATVKLFGNYFQKFFLTNFDCFVGTESACWAFLWWADAVVQIATDGTSPKGFLFHIVWL